MVDLNEVRMFVQVVRAHSFAEAGRRLGVPANTLSRRIRQLETALDTRLMQRSTRRLTLTAAGQTFLERCAPAVDAVTEAGKAMIHGNQQPSGSVRIAVPADFLDLFSIDWVVEFLASQPLIRLDFIMSDARADLIAEGIDVAIRGGTESDSRGAFRHIASQYFILVASPSYLARRGVPESLQSLGEHDCLTVSSRQTRVTWTLLGPSGAEEVKVAGRFSANSARILAKSCLAGVGIGLLPEMLVVADLQAGRLLQVLRGYRREGAHLHVVLPSQEHIPTAVSAFVDFASGKLRTMMQSDAEREFA